MYSRGKYYNSIVGVINYPLYSHLIGSIYIGNITPIPQQGNLIKYTRIYSTIYPYIVRSIYIAIFGYKDTHIQSNPYGTKVPHYIYNEKYTLWYKNTIPLWYKSTTHNIIVIE